MLNIRRFECNPLQENCYVVSDETGDAVVIDCGAFYEEELTALTECLRQLKPTHLLATHGHLDHNFGNRHLHREFGLLVEICADDDYLITRLPHQASTLFGMQIPADQPAVGRYLADGDRITFGTHTLEVIHTPGHSRGSALFYCAEEQVAFTGDTLFRQSIGRTDFEGGSWAEMQQSLQRIAQLPAATKVLPGHGPESTIGSELRDNPYLRI